MPMTCSVCDHPQVDLINSLLAAGTVAMRTIANQYGLGSHVALVRHKAKHLSRSLVKAMERKQVKTEDLFMERHEHLYRETLKYVQDAKLAIKMQKVSVEDGSGKPQDRYQAFRDVGAMAPALQTAVQLQRVLGDATGRFAQAAATATLNVLCVSIPGPPVPPVPQASSPNVIEATSEVVAPGDTEE